MNALLDVNVVAHETEDEVAVLLELVEHGGSRRRHPTSGLAAGRPRPQRIDARTSAQGAKKALVALVRRLAPTDNFGLVTFDDSAQVIVAAGPVTDKEAVIHRILGVQSGGSTDLSAGYLRGLREIRRVSISGGHRSRHLRWGTRRNAGIQDIDEFASDHVQGVRRRPRRRPRSATAAGTTRSSLTAIARPAPGTTFFLRRQPRRCWCFHRRRG